MLMSRGNASLTMSNSKGQVSGVGVQQDEGYHPSA